jgi:hypothetical protein
MEPEAVNVNDIVEPAFVADMPNVPALLGTEFMK